MAESRRPGTHLTGVVVRRPVGIVVRVPVARFDPAVAAAIDELPHNAADQLSQAVTPALETVSEVASVGSAPRSGLALV